MFTCQMMQRMLAGFLMLGLVMAGAATAEDKTDPTGKQNKTQMLELWTPGDSGQRMRIRGRVTSADGSPIPDVRIRFRHADSEGIDRSYHQGELLSNARGLYQFGSVIPGNSHRLSHVHVYIDHPGFRYVATEFHFKEDPKASPDDPDAIFLEESIVNGEKMMYGRWDITLTPL